jgi:hypothetical protein
MSIRIPVIAAIFGGFIGLAIGLPAKYYLLDPYLASQSNAKIQAIEAQHAADNLRRDQMVIENLAKYDAAMRKLACDGYIGGLKEQGLRVSPDLYRACDGS